MTTKKKREAGEGLTPQTDAVWTVPETGEPLSVTETVPKPKRRRAPLAADPTPAYASLQTLADEVLGAIARDEVDRFAAGLRVTELRAERTRLDTEMRQVRSAVRVWKRTFPDALVPTRTVAAFDRTRDAIAENEREMALLRFALAPGVDLEHATHNREQQRVEAERERHARAMKTARALEAAKRQGRREYATLHRVLGHDRPPSSASDPVVASSGDGELIACTPLNCVDHEDHWPSQRVLLADGSTGQIFTGR